MSTTDAKLTRADWLVIASLSMASMLGTLNNAALNPFLPDVAKEMNSTVPVLGQTVTIMFIVSALIGLVAGPLADHYGHRRLLMIGLAALVVNALGTALAPDFVSLFLVRLAGGFAGAVLSGVALAIAGTRFTGEVRRRAVSLAAASMAGGPILGVPLLTTVGGTFGWRWAFAVFAVVAIIGMLLIRKVLAPDPPREVGRFQLSSVLAAYKPILGHMPTFGLIGATALRGLSWNGVITYAGAYFIAERGLSTGMAGIVYVAGGAGFLSGSLAAGGRLGRFPPVQTVVTTTAISGILFGLLFVLPGVPLPLASLAIGGFIGSFGWVAATNLLANTSPAGAGTTMVLNGSGTNLGSAAGGAIGGALIATVGYTTAGLILPVFAFASSLVILISSRR